MKRGERGDLIVSYHAMEKRERETRREKTKGRETVVVASAK